MSYDITIRSDENYSEKTDPESLRAYLRSIPDVEPNGKIGFLYGRSKSLYMELDLEEVDPEGDWIEESEQVNCISVHIPYAFLTTENQNLYLSVVLHIAHHLNWQAIDAQTGSRIAAVL
jgi:hypothetical protein